MVCWILRSVNVAKCMWLEDFHEYLQRESCDTLVRIWTRTLPFLAQVMSTMQSAMISTKPEKHAAISICEPLSINASEPHTP